MTYELKTVGGRVYHVYPETESYRVPKEDINEWERVMTDYTNSFIMKAFNGIPPIKVTVNNRLRNVSGQFVFTENSRDKYVVEVSGKVLTSVVLLGETDEALDYLESLLRHEAIHYVLWFLCVDCDDGNEVFERWVYLLGSHPSGTTPEDKVYKTTIKTLLVQKYLGVCPECGTRGVYSSRGKYYCSPCAELGKRIIFNPKEIAVGVDRNIKRGMKEIEESYVNTIETPSARFTPMERRTKRK